MMEQLAEPATAPEESVEQIDTAARRSRRRRTVQFVVLFVVYVLTFLLGYRFLLNTEANMWYLFTTAKHTSAVLRLMGDSSEVEAQTNVGAPTRKRRELEAWRNGLPAPPWNPDVDSAPSEPLTPYEQWLHRAYQRIRAGETLDESGPQVRFLAKPGLATTISATRAEILELSQNTELSDEEKRDRMIPLAERLRDLEELDRTLPTGSEGARARADKQFTFILVPSCGAIEVISIFLAAVLAFPAGWKRRFIGLVLGLPVLYGVNLIRLSSLAVLAAYDPTGPQLKWFNFAHEYIWQVIFIIFVVAVWLCWIEFIVQRRRP